MRGRLLLVGALLSAVLVSLALAPSASAQLPSSCGLEINASEDNPSTQEFAAGETREFTFQVSNPNQAEARGEMRVSDPRPGWFWDTAPWSGTVAGGSSVTVTVPVSFDGDTSADARFEARLQSVQCGPVFGIDGTSGTPVTLTMTPSPTQGGVADGDSLLPWAVFGVIVLGTAIAIPVYYRRGRVSVEAFCEDPEREVLPGRGTSFPVVLRNKSGEPAHVSLEVSDVQEGWSALTTLPDLELGAKESRTLYMMIRAPDDARPGDLCVAKLLVKPEGGSSEEVKTVSRVIKPPSASKATAEEEDG